MDRSEVSIKRCDGHVTAVATVTVEGRKILPLKRGRDLLVYIPVRARIDGITSSNGVAPGRILILPRRAGVVRFGPYCRQCALSPSRDTAVYRLMVDIIRTLVGSSVAAEC